MTLMPASLQRSTPRAEALAARGQQAAQSEGGDQKTVKKRGFRGHARVQQREGEQRDQPERGGRKQTQKKAHHCLRPVHTGDRAAMQGSALPAPTHAVAAGIVSVLASETEQVSRAHARETCSVRNMSEAGSA